MKIAIINAGVRGPATYCLNLYKYLNSKKHDVLFISESKWEKEKIPLYQAKSYKVLGLAPLVYRPNDLINKIKNFSPDVIHYHWPSGTMDILFYKIINLNIPTVITIHVAVNSKKFLWDKLFYFHFTLFKRHIKKVKCIISISKFIDKQLIDRTKINNLNHYVIYAGVNTDIFKPEKKITNLKDNTLNLVFVGQIMPEKGIDVLIDSVIELQKKKKLNLTIIGSGHLKTLLQKKTKNYSNIKWIGFLKSQQEIANYYANSDLTILPTKWDEAFSLVPVESISCGTPVLATSKGGSPEVVIPNKTGFLINSCDKNLLKKFFYKIEKKDLLKLRKKCREFALENHTLEKWGQQHEKIYNTILNKIQNYYLSCF